jgi:hypothetical protein
MDRNETYDFQVESHVKRGFIITHHGFKKTPQNYTQQMQSNSKKEMTRVEKCAFWNIILV